VEATTVLTAMVLLKIEQLDLIQTLLFRQKRWSSHVTEFATI
jgi:hypothetical protein